MAPHQPWAMLSHLGLPVLPGVPGAQHLLGPGQWWTPLPTAGQSWLQLWERAVVSPRGPAGVWGWGWDEVGGGLFERRWSPSLWCSGPFVPWDLLPTGPDWHLPHIPKAGATDGLPWSLRRASELGSQVTQAQPGCQPTWALQPLPQPPFIIFL